MSRDSFGTWSSLEVGGRQHHYYNLQALEKKGLGDVSRLPFCLKILLENLLRNEDGELVKAQDIEALLEWDPVEKPSRKVLVCMACWLRRVASFTRYVFSLLVSSFGPGADV